MQTTALRMQTYENKNLEQAWFYIEAGSNCPLKLQIVPQM